MGSTIKERILPADWSAWLRVYSTYCFQYSRPAQWRTSTEILDGDPRRRSYCTRKVRSKQLLAGNLRRFASKVGPVRLKSGRGGQSLARQIASNRESFSKRSNGRNKSPLILSFKFSPHNCNNLAGEAPAARPLSLGEPKRLCRRCFRKMRKC